MQIELCNGQAFFIIEALGKLANACDTDDELVIVEIIETITAAAKAELVAKAQPPKVVGIGGGVGSL